MRTTLIIVVAAALAGGLIGAVVGLGLGGTSGTATTTAASAEELFDRDARGVVAIEAREVTLGAGFVVDKRGDVVTNDHVVHGSTGIRVGFSSGESYPARVVGADPAADVAVVRVTAPASALHALKLADPPSIAVGERVYAIGLDRTITSGLVDATGADTIQTDARIDRGSSGGPLVDRAGEVIGITDKGTADTASAVPSGTAWRAAAALIARGHAR